MSDQFPSNPSHPFLHAIYYHELHEINFEQVKITIFPKFLNKLCIQGSGTFLNIFILPFQVNNNYFIRLHLKIYINDILV